MLNKSWRATNDLQNRASKAMLLGLNSNFRLWGQGLTLSMQKAAFNTTTQSIVFFLATAWAGETRQGVFRTDQDPNQAITKGVDQEIPKQRKEEHHTDQ